MPFLRLAIFLLRISSTCTPFLAASRGSLDSLGAASFFRRDKLYLEYLPNPCQPHGSLPLSISHPVPCLGRGTQSRPRVHHLKSSMAGEDVISQPPWKNGVTEGKQASFLVANSLAHPVPRCSDTNIYRLCCLTSLKFLNRLFSAPISRVS